MPVHRHMHSGFYFFDFLMPGTGLLLCYNDKIIIKIKNLMFIDKKVLTYVKNYYIVCLTINIKFLLFIVFLARGVKNQNNN